MNIFRVTRMGICNDCDANDFKLRALVLNAITYVREFAHYWNKRVNKVYSTTLAYRYPIIMQETLTMYRSVFAL